MLCHLQQLNFTNYKCLEARQWSANMTNIPSVFASGSWMNISTFLWRFCAVCDPISWLSDSLRKRHPATTTVEIGVLSATKPSGICSKNASTSAMLGTESCIYKRNIFLCDFFEKKVAQKTLEKLCFSLLLRAKNIYDIIKTDRVIHIQTSLSVGSIYFFVSYGYPFARKQLPLFFLQRFINSGCFTRNIRKHFNHPELNESNHN